MVANTKLTSSKKFSKPLLQPHFSRRDAEIGADNSLIDESYQLYQVVLQLREEKEAGQQSIGIEVINKTDFALSDNLAKLGAALHRYAQVWEPSKDLRDGSHLSEELRETARLHIQHNFAFLRQFQHVSESSQRILLGLGDELTPLRRASSARGMTSTKSRIKSRRQSIQDDSLLTRQSDQAVLSEAASLAASSATTTQREALGNLAEFADDEEAMASWV
eukprot:m.749894 g.749894  ORF g.749894 m.749894 type:complete len:220 (+) comp58978_c0_seq3:1561-2220(+)